LRAEEKLAQEISFVNRYDYDEVKKAPSKKGYPYVEQEKRCKKTAKAKEDQKEAEQSGYSAYCKLSFGSVEMNEFADERITVISLE